jgi:hypothetical protein
MIARYMNETRKARPAVDAAKVARTKQAPMITKRIHFKAIMYRVL